MCSKKWITGYIYAGSKNKAFNEIEYLHVLLSWSTGFWQTGTLLKTPCYSIRNSRIFSEKEFSTLRKCYVIWYIVKWSNIIVEDHTADTKLLGLVF